MTLRRATAMAYSIRRLLPPLLFGMVMISFTIASAQIFINPDDFPNVTGMTLTYYTNTTTSVLVNVGQSGANQTWDFQQGPEEQQTQEQIVQTSATPLYEQFPTANRTRLSDTNPFGIPGEVYTYREMSNDSLTLLGYGANIQGMNIPIALGNGLKEYPMPLTYQDAWNNTITFDTTFTIANPDTTIPLDSLDCRLVVDLGDQAQVDGWGTLNGPMGDLPVLRARHDTGIEATLYVWMIIIWVPVWDTSYVQIRYEWLAHEYGPIVTVASQPGETNPNFDHASRVLRMMPSTNVPSAPETPVPLAITLSPNYPNPFNESTAMTFSLPNNLGKASLDIYNVLGQKVVTLWEGTADGKMHQVIWNGRNSFNIPVSSGTYFINLSTRKIIQTRIIIKLD
jgi:hypothetical protein